MAGRHGPCCARPPRPCCFAMFVFCLGGNGIGASTKGNPPLNCSKHRERFQIDSHDPKKAPLVSTKNHVQPARCPRLATRFRSLNTCQHTLAGRIELARYEPWRGSRPLSASTRYSRASMLLPSLRGPDVSRCSLRFAWGGNSPGKRNRQPILDCSTQEPVPVRRPHDFTHNTTCLFCVT